MGFSEYMNFLKGENCLISKKLIFCGLVVRGLCYTSKVIKSYLHSFYCIHIVQMQQNYPEKCAICIYYFLKGQCNMFIQFPIFFITSNPSKNAEYLRVLRPFAKLLMWENLLTKHFFRRNYQLLKH